ncbi:MAG: serine hydrolase [Rikenellaceae bacterium]|nr:serine hydrolase [Rikenellaceae bacterium]
MKRFFLLATFVCAALFTSCEGYDDSELVNRLDNFETRLKKLEELCSQMNTNITSLQTIVNAIQKNDQILAVAPIIKDGKELGYTISFTSGKSITIYNASNGVAPTIGVKKHTDGNYYWTIDGEWLTDDKGNKIKANGKDGTDGENGENGENGITPQMKIENGFWYISYDNGSTWEQLGKATGEDGVDGDSFFQNVTEDDDNVYFILADGTTITIAKSKSIVLTYIPRYSDGKATVSYSTKEDSFVEFDFEVSPASAAADWSEFATVKAVYTQTRAAVEFVEMEILGWSVDAENGTITVKASGANLCDAFFDGEQEASARLAIQGNGINLTSEYITMIAFETPNPSLTGNDITSLSLSPWNNTGLTAVCSGFLLFDTYNLIVPVGYEIGEMVFDIKVSEGAKVTLEETKTKVVSGETKINASKLFFLTVTAGNGEKKLFYVDVRNGVDAFDKKVLTFMRNYNLPGMSVSVADKGKLVYSRGYGYADKENRERMDRGHMMRISSASKPFCSMAIQRLIDEGKLSLTDRPFAEGGILAEDFPDIKAGNEKITIRNLLEHQNGWNDNTDPYDPMYSLTTNGMTSDQTIEYALKRYEFSDEPGTMYNYSNLGYCILGRVIEKITGMEYEDYMQQEVAEKAGAYTIQVGTDTKEDRLPNECVYYAPDGYNAYGKNMRRLDACAGLIASTDDLVRVCSAIDGLDGYPEIFPQSTLDRMFTPSASYNRYCLGWRMNHSSLLKGCMYHTGNIAGTASLMIRGGDGHHIALVNNSRTYDSFNGTSLDTDQLILGDELWNFRSLPTEDLFE